MGSDEKQLAPPALLRLRRFAALRAAQRVLAPSVRPPGLEPAEEEARRILGELRELSARTRSYAPGDTAAALEESEPTPDDLQRIDESLARLSARLLAVLDGLPLAQLRATLPELARRHREEVGALVDLVLEGGLDAARFALVDYAVTLLSTQERDGRRELTRDPSSVTGCLAALAQATKDDAECARIEQAFRDATSEIEQGTDAQPIIERVRAYKVDHAGRLLHPRVLAAMVSYNVAVWNRFATLAESKRTLDQLDLERFEEELGFPEYTSEAAADSTEAPLEAPAEARSPAYTGPSLLGSPGLGAISEAMRRQLAGEEPGRGEAAAIAGGAGLRDLRDWEKEALQDTTNDPRLSLVRAAVVIGLTRRQLPDLAVVLQELDIEPAMIDTRWVDEVDAELSREAQALMKAGDHEQACCLLDTKTRYLYTPVSKQRREPSAAPRTVGRSAPAAQPTTRSIHRTALVAVLCLALAGALLFNFVRPKTGSLALYSPIELARISPHIESAYRNGMGAGPLFMGTVGNGWLDLDAPARTEAARMIGETLALRGVRSVMLFDSRRRLQVQYRNDALVFAAPPSRRPGSAGP